MAATHKGLSDKSISYVVSTSLSLSLIVYHAGLYFTYMCVYMCFLSLKGVYGEINSTSDKPVPSTWDVKVFASAVQSLVGAFCCSHTVQLHDV